MQTLCLNCEFQETAYSVFCQLRDRARELFDPAKSNVKHIYVLMLGIVRQWVKRKNEPTQERLARIKAAKEKKYVPITLDRAKVYKIGQQIYNYDPEAKFWFRREVWQKDELGDPLSQEEMAELVAGLRMAG